MTTLVNGQQTQQISVSDRGLLYGQSVFETIAIHNTRPLLWDAHIARLQRGCQVLGIPVGDEELGQIEGDAELLCQNLAKAVLRITLTMGEGGRGYQNPAKPTANRILSIHDYPTHSQRFWQDGIELGLANIRLASQSALAGIKHGNRLEQIIARGQWQPNWQEALLLNTEEEVIEATQSNVFMVKNQRLLTPALNQSGVAGVIRDYIIANADKIGVPVESVSLSVPDIEAADEVFVCNSLIGLWPVKRFNETLYNTFDMSFKLLNLMKKNEVIPNF